MSDTHLRINCPACGSSLAKVLVNELDLKSPVFQIYFRDFYPPAVGALINSLSLPPAQLRACENCATVFHAVVPSDKVLAAFYSSLQGTTISVETPIETHRQEQRFLELMMVVRFLGSTPARPAVLDFGTGDGSWARLAAAAGCHVTASDTADDAFQALTLAGISCVAPDKLSAGAFDFINVEQVFEHLPDPAAIIGDLFAALKPGGVLKIGVPYDPELRAKLANPNWNAAKNSPASLNSVAPVEHLNAFTPQGLAQLGINAGLLPMNITGWTLLDPRIPHQTGVKSRLMRALRDRLGQHHRPPYRLAQTRFFLRPA